MQFVYSSVCKIYIIYNSGFRREPGHYRWTNKLRCIDHLNFAGTHLYFAADFLFHIYMSVLDQCHCLSVFMRVCNCREEAWQRPHHISYEEGKVSLIHFT